MNIIRKLKQRFIYHCPSMFCPVKKGEYCPLFDTINCPYDTFFSYYCNASKQNYLYQNKKNTKQK